MMKFGFNAAALLLALMVGSLQVLQGEAKMDIEKCALKANRLPPLFTPDNYRLTLEPDLPTHKFSASLDILATYTGDCGSTKQPFASLIKQVCMDTVTCGMSHCAVKRRVLLNVGKTIEIDDIQVSKASADGSDKIETIAVDSICMDPATQLMEINLARKLKPEDKILISFTYKGQIAKESRGLYESLNRVEGQSVPTTTNANTHFFPADARSTFPSFDQPDLKASFELTLVHDKDLVAVSNSKKLSETTDEATQKKIVQFERTPKMSTYVFAFAVGHYETISCTAEGMSETVVTAYAPLGRSKDAQFVLDTACKSIPIAEQYFMREFPLKKLDLLVTRQQRDPCRENWGMLVFTEEFLLTDADTTNVLRVEIAKLVTHNVLHHWFGDLVTAKWWDDQWIFDGFTIWRSHVVASQIYPEFDYNFNYLLRTQTTMLDAHANETVHAIKTYQDLTADQELALFDSITYNKAAAVYHTIHARLGEFMFRDSLATFVSENAYGSGDAASYFKAMKTATGLDMDKLVTTWLDQPGAPLVSVERVGKEILIKQERLGAALSAKAKKQRWSIPVDITFVGDQSETTVRVILDDSSMRVKMPVWFDSFRQNHWFKVNPNMASFYRVNYSSDVLARLKKPIESKLMSPEDRYNIIDDLRALYNLDKITAQDLEAALKWYEDELNGGVVSALAVAVQNYGAKEGETKATEIAHRVFDQVFEASRFQVVDNEGHAQMNGRQDALAMLVRYNYQEAIDEALKVFESSDVHLAPFLRKPVYLAVLRNGSAEQKDRLFKRLAQTKLAYERQILISGLVSLLGPEDNQVRELLQSYDFDAPAARQ